MRTLRRLIIGLLVLGAVCTTAAWALAGEPDAGSIRSTRAPTPSPPAPALPTPAPPTTTPTPGLALPLQPRPLRVAWAGDSVASTLADAVAAEAATRGIELVDRTAPGCGMVRGLPADDALVPVGMVRACDDAVPVRNAGTAASGADVVTWLSTWETSNRIVDGGAYVFGTPEGDAGLLRLVDESAQRLMSGGARLVLLTMPPSTTGPERPVVTEADIRGALHLNALLRQYAAAHADRVGILDLAAVVCPDGPLCAPEEGGVTLRPNDGGHFAGAGPAWVAPRLLDLLVGAG